MRRNLSPAVDLNFLDGYLFRLIQQLANERGLEESGLYNYYGGRITSRLGGLSEHDEGLARHLLARETKRVVHAGIGIGTLSCALACNGVAVVGIEAEKRRAATARLVKDAVTEIWPDIRYEVVEGFFPDVLAGKSFVDSTLVFTNVAASWDDAALERVIGSMVNFGDVFLDLKVFGSTRLDEASRDVLFERIAKSARSAERLPHVAINVDLAHFVFA